MVDVLKRKEDDDLLMMMLRESAGESWQPPRPPAFMGRDAEAMLDLQRCIFAGVT